MKQAVACVVYRDAARREALIVRRPDDDPDLPGIWGLPAASLRPGESWKDAVARAGREKLGVRLVPERVLAAGEGARPGFVLRMRLYEARVEDGEPHVPQPVPGVTQYSAWRWGDAALLEPGAARGSLCCRLFIEMGEGAASSGDPWT